MSPCGLRIGSLRYVISQFETFRALGPSGTVYGRFAPWTFRPLTGRFAPDCGRFAPVCFSMCLLFFLEHQNVTDGWTDRIAINVSHKCGDTR